MKIRRNYFFMIGIIFLLGLVLLSMLVAVCLGSVKIPLFEVYNIMAHKIFGQQIMGDLKPSHIDIIWQLRLPRVLMAAIAGAALSMSGAVMQASVQNPLAEPYILGIASGASFGAVIAILIGGIGGFVGTTIWAFGGAILATVLVMFLAGLRGQMSTVKMVLAGAVVSALLSAGANFIIYMSNNAEGMRSVTFWTMGSFAGAKWSTLFLPAVGTGFAGILFLSQARKLNVMLLGEEAALTLGIDLVSVRRFYMILTALLTAIIVSACGVFGFVGLVIPHIVRSLIGSDHRKLMPVVILSGSFFLIWADVLSRVLLKSGDLPIGIITALIGAPFFMYLLFKQSFNFGNS